MVVAFVALGNLYLEVRSPAVLPVVIVSSTTTSTGTTVDPTQTTRSTAPEGTTTVPAGGTLRPNSS